MLAFIAEDYVLFGRREGAPIVRASEYFQTGGARLKIINFHSPSAEGELCEAMRVSHTSFFDSLKPSPTTGRRRFLRSPEKIAQRKNGYVQPLPRTLPGDDTAPRLPAEDLHFHIPPRFPALSAEPLPHQARRFFGRDVLFRRQHHEARFVLFHGTPPLFSPS